MSYRFLEHATDAIVEVRAPDMDAAFQKAAESVVEITLDMSLVQDAESRKVSVHGRDLCSLLLNWLEEINYQIITEGFAIQRLNARVSQNGECSVDATLYGEPLDLKRHGFKVEIKAPTLHQMLIKEENFVLLRFLLDL